MRTLTISPALHPPANSTGRKTWRAAEARLFRQHVLLRAGQACEMAAERGFAFRAQACGAFLYDRGCQLRHARGGRAYPRSKTGRREDRSAPPRPPKRECSRTSHRFQWESPRSDPRQKLRRGAGGVPSGKIQWCRSRAWRRFMRFRIMLSPDCTERWKCGISRSSSAIARSNASSTSMESMDDRRRRWQFRHQLAGGARPACPMWACPADPRHRR